VDRTSPRPAIERSRRASRLIDHTIEPRPCPGHSTLRMRTWRQLASRSRRALRGPPGSLQTLRSISLIDHTIKPRRCPRRSQKERASSGAVAPASTRGALFLLAPFREGEDKLGSLTSTRKVDVRLPGKGNSNSHGERPVHLIITIIKWIRTSRLSIKNSLCIPRGRGVSHLRVGTVSSSSSSLLSSLELSDAKVYEP